MRNAATERSEEAARQRVFNRRAAPRRITCCEDDRLSQLLGGRVFHVKHGQIE